VPGISPSWSAVIGCEELDELIGVLDKRGPEDLLLTLMAKEAEHRKYPCSGYIGWRETEVEEFERLNSPPQSAGMWVRTEHFNNPVAVRAGMYRKLAESGIPVEAIEGIASGKKVAEPLTADEVFKITGWAQIPAYRIIYYDGDGHQLDHLRL